MPIYEYKCKKCSSEFEVFQKISEPDAKRCKFCNGPVNKLVSLSSFQLQGSGWYVTDYGGKKPATSNEGKQETTTESAAPKESTTSSSETKE